MNISDFLRQVISRWKIVGGCAFLGVLVAFATLPVPKHHHQPTAPYVVTSKLGVSLRASAGGSSKNTAATTGGGVSSVSHLAALGLNPSVAEKAAAALGGNADPKKLAKNVSFSTDLFRNNVIVKAKDLKPGRATDVSKAFANGLISAAVDEQVANQQKNEQFIQNQLDNLAQKIRGGGGAAASAPATPAASPTTAPTVAAGTPTTAPKPAKGAKKAASPSTLGQPAAASPGDPIAQAQLNAELTHYTALYGELQDVQSQDPTKPPMTLLQVTKPALDKKGIKAAPKNKSRKIWAAEGLFGGLLLGLLIAVILTLMDRSLGDPAAFEAAFGLPVLADIPRLSTKARQAGLIVTADRPLSASAEEYRRLRSALERMPAHIVPVPGGEPAPLGPARDPLSGSRRTDGSVQTVAMVGAGPRLGTSTSVANLAAALAEARIRPLAVDVNLRRPMLHRLLRTDLSPGVTEEVEGWPRADRDCRLAGVRVLPAGAAVSNPAVYIRRAAGLIAAWRSRADVVVLDVADIASTNDLADLSDEADALLVVCGKRVTTRKDATRTTNALGVLGAPVLGLVLVDVKRSWQDRLQRGSPRVARPARSADTPLSFEPAEAVEPTSPYGMTATDGLDNGNGTVEAPHLVTSAVVTSKGSDPPEADRPGTKRRRAPWRRG